MAECCTEEKCNKNLFPMLTEHSSTVKDVVASPAAEPNSTQPGTTQAPKSPTSVGIKMKAFFYLPIFLLVILDIMS